MELLIVERQANGPFAGLDDFAARVDPRLLNRRQLEALAAAGAFDAIASDRAAVFTGAETILAHAARALDERTSGQGGLFGDAGAGTSPIRLPAVAPWTLAERMTAEKDAFGFYFSAHPTDRYRHLATAMGARSFAELSSYPAPADGGRTESRMAVLVESAGWRTSAKGRRYMMATCSDATAQFVATCFDDEVAADLEGAARTGSCGFARVELDRKPGEETPRVTIKHLRPFEEMQDSTKLKLVVAVDEAAALDRLARICAGARGGRGELVLNAAIDGGVAELRLARDLKIDAELAALIERVPGVGSVTLLAGESVPLALVS